MKKPPLHNLLASIAVISVALLALGAVQVAAGTDIPAAAASTPHYVILSDMESVRIDDKGLFHVRKELLCKALDQRGADTLARRIIRYDAAADTVIIEAARIPLADGTWRNAELNGFGTPVEPEVRRAPAYEHFVQQAVLFPGLKAGTMTHLAYRIDPKPGAPAFVSRKGGVVLFGDYVPVVDKQYSLRAPLVRTIQYGIQNSDVVPTVEEEEGYKVYTWTFHNCPQIVPEPHSVGIAHLVPRLLWTTFSDWEALGIFAADRFWNRVDASQYAVDGYFQMTSPDLRGTPALMNAALWTLMNVRDVTLPLDITGYLPVTADSVAQNRYGTPMDKAVLLTAILRAYGFNPTPVLVPMEDAPFSHVPVLEQFRHVILAVPNGTDTVWLDPSAESYAPGSVPYECTLGRGCMLVAGAPLIIKVPVAEGTEPTRTEIRATLENNGALAGFAECTPRADAAAQARKALIHLGSADRARYAERTAQRIGSAATVDEFYVSNVSDMVSSVMARVRFNCPQFARPDSGRLVLTIPDSPFDFAQAAFDTAAEVHYPVRFTAHGKVTTECGITLPQGYQLLSLPPPLIIENPYVHIELSIRILSHGLEWNKAVEIKSNQVPVADYRMVRDAFRAVESAENRRLIVAPERPVKPRPKAPSKPHRNH